MQIELLQVVPDFLEPEKLQASGIWHRELKFMAGSNVQIIAPSGSGKTSLVHFLYGLRKDYAGRILYDAKDIRGFDAEDFSVYRRRHFSIVFQDLRLFTEQTVFENLEVKRQLEPFHQQSRIREMAARLGIENKLEKLCRTCSYGEQQRIAIIRALQQPFDFLLLDEPFSHLDERNRQIAMELMQEEASLRSASIILADLKGIEFFKSDTTINL